MALLLLALIFCSVLPEEQDHLVVFNNGSANVRWDSLKDGAVLTTKSLLGHARSAVFSVLARSLRQRNDMEKLVTATVAAAQALQTPLSTGLTLWAEASRGSRAS